MSKKAIHLISFVLLLAFAGSASAATIEWDNGGEGPLWNVAENWEPDGVPGAGDTVRFYLEDANAVIDSTVNAECTTFYVGAGNAGPCYLDMTGGTLTTSGHFRVGEGGDSNGVFIVSGGVGTSTGGRLWVGINGTGALIMRGGELNIYDKIEVGKNASGIGTIYMEGGVLNLTGNSTDLEVGKYGTGTVHMTGGVINLQDNIKLAQGSTSTTTGVGRLNLYGGTFNAGNLRNPADGIYGTPLIDITEGVLTLPGDYREIVNEYIERGWLVAYDGLGVVEVTWTLDPNETTVIGRGLDPELAWDPTPRNRATASRPVVLSWQSGVYAAAHDVYFGTDFNDVNDASRDNPGTLVNQGQDTNTYDPGPLALGQTYYWRIDEVNDANAASPWRGVVWQFTIADYVVVDDFESYNDIFEGDDSHVIYFIWVDGYADQSANGAVIGYTSGDSMEKDTFHGGKQSVPIAYYNNSAPYSEATVNAADLPIGTDWSMDNLSVLSLWFYGSAFNAPELMYVKLNGVKVAYDGPATDLQQAAWKEWKVDLAAFGVDLSEVTEFGIGFDRADAFGGIGTVFFDDIRLYPPAEEQ